MQRITSRSYVELATHLSTGEEEPLDVWRVERGWSQSTAISPKISLAPSAATAASAAFAFS